MPIISRSKDCHNCGANHSNLCYTVYHDGWYCYSCHTGSRKSSEHYVFRPQELVTEKKKLVVPANTLNINKFSVKALEWLYSYYVYDDLISNSRIAYCESTEHYPESLLLPVLFDQDNNLIEYQRRFFPKAFFSSSGVKDVVFISGKGDKLIIVEDYISALRVGQHTPCLCLFGTSFKPNVMLNRLMQYTDISIWLDNDEPGIVASDKIFKQLQKEYKIQAKLRPMLYQNDINIRQIKTQHSAKDYCDYEIKNIIGDTGVAFGDILNSAKHST